MKSIKYIFFALAHFSLYEHAVGVAQVSSFLCDLPESRKPAIGICAPDGLKPTGNDPLINFISNPALARQLHGQVGFTWWTCDYAVAPGAAALASYCCSVAPNDQNKFAAACRRQA
ncbi:hypothetical protein DFH28DRAFT_925410 [Melampsora americana]|nr:hypothetical protein DFH28DRAFT_925410 [Melampsora americana]